MKIAVSTGNSRMDKKWNLTEMELEDCGVYGKLPYG